MSSPTQRQQAEEQVDKKLGFFIHLIVYAAVNSLLVIINVTGNYDSLWFIWPLGGWGLGILFHALSVFVFNEQSSSFRERLIEREMKARRESTKSN